MNAVVPIVTPVASDRGWGSWPVTTAVAEAPVGAGANAWTVATVDEAPPPKTTKWRPRTAPAASWTGEVRVPSDDGVPAGVWNPDTAGVVADAAVRPPRTTSWEPVPGNATSRLSTAGSCQGSSPDSTAGMGGGGRVELAAAGATVAARPASTAREAIAARGHRG